MILITLFTQKFCLFTLEGTTKLYILLEKFVRKIFLMFFSNLKLNNFVFSVLINGLFFVIDGNTVPRLQSAADGEMLRLRSLLQQNPKMPPNSNANGQNQQKGPLRVFIGVFIESMGNFRAEQMSFDVDLYLYSNWRDPSLAHNHSGGPILINDPRVKDRIWLPDLYFANAKSSKFHEVTAPNFNLFIDSDGQIASSTRITLNVACNLDLTRYPMDHQKCIIRMLSYAYIASQVNITWFSRRPTRYNLDIELPQFRLISVSGKYCDGTYSYAIMENGEQRDQFSCLDVVILLERQLGFHLVQSYIPTALIVMVSWVSFWIDRSAAPARVTLSFTALLTLSTLGNGMRFGLPQVSYAKAIDYWFGACMLFVFLNLLEYAAVNSYLVISQRFDKMSKNKANASDNSGKALSADDGKEASSKLIDPNDVDAADQFRKIAKRYDWWSLKIDQMSRIVFPLLFGVWNAFYWFYYYLWYTE